MFSERQFSVLIFVIIHTKSSSSSLHSVCSNHLNENVHFEIRSVCMTLRSSSGVARGVRGVRAAPGGTCWGQQMGENCKKNHGKIQIVRRHLLQLSAADSASDQSSKFKELDIDSCSALTLLKDYEVGVY